MKLKIVGLIFLGLVGLYVSYAMYISYTLMHGGLLG